MKRILLLVFVLLLSGHVAEAQKQKKKVLHTTDEIKKEAIAELDVAMKAPDGELYLWSQEEAISGKYTIHISVREKGEVATVFCDKQDGGSIDDLKELKDELRDFRFNFKMPKGKSVKFEYVFEFNR